MVASPPSSEEDAEDNIFSYNVTTCISPDEFESVEDQIAQDIVVAYIAAGADPE